MGRPIARLEPPAMSSSGPLVEATSSATSASSRGLKASVMRGGSEPWQLTPALSARVNVHPTLLGTAMQRGEDFSRIEAHIRIERPLDAMLYLEVDGVELIRHQISL